MALTTNEKNKLAAAINRAWSGVGKTTTLGKTDIKTLIDNIDGYVETIQTAFNQALDPAIRTQITAGDKSFFFLSVLVARYMQEPDILQILNRLVGEAIREVGNGE